MISPDTEDEQTSKSTNDSTVLEVASSLKEVNNKHDDLASNCSTSVEGSVVSHSKIYKLSTANTTTFQN